MDKDCVFCKIADGSLASDKLYEVDDILAFLDLYPATRGQTLIILKKHVDYIFDLENREYTNLFLKAKELGKAIDKALKPVRTCIVVEGFSVGHVHIRLHPCYEQTLKLGSSEKAENEDLKATAEKIKKFL